MYSLGSRAWSPLGSQVSKARAVLGWTPTFDQPELIRLLCLEDVDYLEGLAIGTPRSALW